MTITASKGTKWMNMLSNIAVPIVLIFGFISIIRAFNDVGGVAGINALVKEDSITFAKAVALGVGSYVVGSVMFTPDIMRFAKNAKTSIIVMIITIMVGNSFMVFFGAIGSVVYGDPDIMGVLALQGLLAPAFIVMVLNIWSTAQGCVYSGSMSLSSVIKVPRNKLTLVFGLVGTILGCVGFYNLFGSYINFLSSTVPPIVGIVFADFLTKYNHGYTDLDSLPRADIGGFVLDRRRCCHLHPRSPALHQLRRRGFPREGHLQQGRQEAVNPSAPQRAVPPAGASFGMLPFEISHRHGKERAA